MTTKTVRGATTRRLSALLSLLGVAGAAAASAAPASEDRSPPAQADGARVLAETADVWTIDFVESTTDLNGTGTEEDQIVLEYDIGKGDEDKRIVRPFFFAKGCEEDPGVDAISSMSKESKNATHDTLTVSYDVTPSALTGSNLWNNVTNAIEYCHVLKLDLYNGDLNFDAWAMSEDLLDPPIDGSLYGIDDISKFEGDMLQISSDTREFTLKILTSFNFSIGVNQSQVDEEIASAEANLADFVEACRCGGADFFVCDDGDEPLTPNDELSVCIYSRSDNVQVGFVDTVDLVQGDADLPLIADDASLIPSITTLEYVPDEGVAVATRVPSNLFTFAAGQTLTLFGTVTMEFKDGRRELLALGAGDGRSLQAGEQEDAPFELKIALAKGEETPEAATLSSPAAVAKQGIVAVGAVLGVVYNLFW